MRKSTPPLKPFGMAAFFAATALCLHAGTPAEAQAAISVTKTSRPICDNDAITTTGLNACKVALRFDITTDSEDVRSADVTCKATFDFSSRKFPKGTSETRYATENIAIKDKAASAKIYVNWRRLMDPATAIKVTQSGCSIERLYGTQSQPVQKPLPTATVPEPSTLPDPQEDAAATPAPPAPAEAPKSALTPEMELELLKEKNRARELEVKALELKIRLKELEK